eukprot:3210586-Prorocentrum_lima.AAC.1
MVCTVIAATSGACIAMCLPGLYSAVCHDRGVPSSVALLPHGTTRPPPLRSGMRCGWWVLFHVALGQAWGVVSRSV